MILKRFCVEVEFYRVIRVKRISAESDKKTRARCIQ
jgi:hypothetical protein